MEIFYKIITLGVLMSILYAGASIYNEIKLGENKSNMGKLLINIFINMVKIIFAFSLVCTIIMFLFLKPVMELLS